MKSIVEEASSVSKAVEQAWKRAGQPTDFSIRIHELAEKNMFGFTSKPAKISFVYQEEHKNKPAHQASHASSTGPIPATSKPTVIKTAQKKPVQKILKPEAKKPATGTNQVRTERSERNDAGVEPWSPEMVSFAQRWLQELLNNLELSNIAFEIVPQRYHLKIRFLKPVFAEEEKNRIFFRNCAHLILQATRNSFKRPLKGFKAILTTEQA
jgi:hypothetical protein